MKELTQVEVKRLFNYRDGFLFWRVSPNMRIMQGDIAGCQNVVGYWCVGISGKCYKVHRIIYLMHNGYLPEFLDHIDGNKSNNKIQNLRQCTKSQNAHNRITQKNNTSGAKGVSWNKNANKWQAQITINWKLKYLGLYNNIKDAKIAVDAARISLHREFANHGMLK